LCRYLKPIPSRNAMGAPGLAFETWDHPRKGQSRPSSISGYTLFIRSVGDLSRPAVEGSAVSLSSATEVKEEN
jgi:hypothetical protein